MNEDSHNPSVGPPIEPELEARIIALVLGEASDFEEAELNRLIDDQPELAAFKKEMQHLHGMLEEVGHGEDAAPEGDWKLPAEQRNKVLAVIQREAIARPEPTAQPIVDPLVVTPQQQSWFGLPWKMTATVCSIAVCGFLVMQSVFWQDERAASVYFSNGATVAEGVPLAGGTRMTFEGMDGEATADESSLESLLRDDVRYNRSSSDFYSMFAQSADDHKAASDPTSSLGGIRRMLLRKEKETSPALLGDDIQNATSDVVLNWMSSPDEFGETPAGEDGLIVLSDAPQAMDAIASVNELVTEVESETRSFESRRSKLSRPEVIASPKANAHLYFDFPAAADGVVDISRMQGVEAAPGLRWDDNSIWLESLDGSIAAGKSPVTDERTLKEQTLGRQVVGDEDKAPLQLGKPLQPPAVANVDKLDFDFSLADTNGVVLPTEGRFANGRYEDSDGGGRGGEMASGGGFGGGTSGGFGGGGRFDVRGADGGLGDLLAAGLLADNNIDAEWGYRAPSSRRQPSSGETMDGYAGTTTGTGTGTGGNATGGSAGDGTDDDGEESKPESDFKPGSVRDSVRGDVSVDMLPELPMLILKGNSDDVAQVEKTIEDLKRDDEDLFDAYGRLGRDSGEMASSGNGASGGRDLGALYGHSQDSQGERQFAPLNQLLGEMDRDVAVSDGRQSGEHDPATPRPEIAGMLINGEDGDGNSDRSKGSTDSPEPPEVFSFYMPIDGSANPKPEDQEARIAGQQGGGQQQQNRGLEKLSLPELRLAEPALPKSDRQSGQQVTPLWGMPAPVVTESSPSPGAASEFDASLTTRGRSTAREYWGKQSPDETRQREQGEAKSELSIAGAIVETKPSTADDLARTDSPANKPQAGFDFGLEEETDLRAKRIVTREKQKLERQIAQIETFKKKKTDSALSGLSDVDESFALPFEDYPRPEVKKWGELLSKKKSAAKNLETDEAPIVNDRDSEISVFTDTIDDALVPQENEPAAIRFRVLADQLATADSKQVELMQSNGTSRLYSSLRRYGVIGGQSELTATGTFRLPAATNRIAPPAGLNETSTQQEAFSTFSLHVSDVSFKLAQTALARGEWPDAKKIRIEEFVNAFDYGDPLPGKGERVGCRLEQSIHPFLQQRNVMRIAMRTAVAGRSSNVPLRLTFLLDNSGSMERVDRQQTIRKAFALLAEQLTPIDSVTLISFARQPRLLADRVSGKDATKLVQLISDLPSEGGTNIESALRLAFEKAKEQHTPGAQSRIVLLTDGAVNLGDADPESLSQMVMSMRDAGVAFDAAGIVADGLNDEVLEALTRKGDGRYYLLDSPESADDGFARQIAGALRPSAKNVKVQVEFNPKRVARFKLLGFEKHVLKKEDFRNDKVDAAEMAAEEAGVAMYQFEAMPDGEGDVGSVSVRFRDLSSGQMVENRWPIPYEAGAPRPDLAAPSLRIAMSAAMLAAKLRGEPLGETVNLQILSQLVSGLPAEYCAASRVQQLLQMIEQARQLSQK